MAIQQQSTQYNISGTMGKNKQQRELARKKAAKLEAQQATLKAQQDAAKAAKQRAAWAAKFAKDVKATEDAKRKRDAEDEALVAQCLREGKNQPEGEARPPRPKMRSRSTRGTKTIYVDSESSEDEDNRTKNRNPDNKALLDTYGILASQGYNAASNGSSDEESVFSVEPTDAEDSDPRSVSSGDSDTD